MATLQRITTDSVMPTHDHPPAERIISGVPRFTTWSLHDGDGLYCGIWECTPGKWRILYDEWEYCRIISGRSVITDERGAAHILEPGDSFVIPRGFRGTWEVVETTRKDYVIRT